MVSRKTSRVRGRLSWSGRDKNERKLKKQGEGRNGEGK